MAKKNISELNKDVEPMLEKFKMPNSDHEERINILKSDHKERIKTLEAKLFIFELHLRMDAVKRDNRCET